MFELLIHFALAADLPGEELFVAPTQKTESVIKEVPVALEVESNSTTQSKPFNTKQVPRRKTPVERSGNLPNYFTRQRSAEAPSSQLIQKPSGSVEYLRAVQVGDSIQATVQHSVIAFPDEKAPVVAQINSGSLRGMRIIGESHLERNSRRIFINFDRLVVGGRIFKVKAQGVSSKGQPGLIGKYYSREAEYFAGDFLSSFVAGYFDGLVPRKTNVFGEVEADTSVDSAVKKGLASGALSSSERFREKLKKVPEFSEIKGPIELTILILDQPKKE